MRVCHIVEATFAGVGRHALDLADGMAARGSEVELIWSPTRAEPAFIRRLEQARYKHHVVHMQRAIGAHDLKALVKIREILRSSPRLDVVHGHSSKGGAMARLAGLGSHSKVVYTSHALAAMDQSIRPITRKAYALIERHLSSVTSAVIAVSPQERDFAESIGIPASKLTVIPNGIEHIAYVGREEARASAGVVGDRFVVGFVGRLSSQKAPEVLLQAARPLLEMVSNALILLVGDGPLMGQLQAVIERERLSDAVRLLGWRDGRQLMPAFDVLALPSRYEGLPYVALEALAAGIPVVATSTAGCGLVVESGINGFVVDPERPDLLAQALASVAHHQGKTSSLRDAALRTSAAFSIDRMVEATLGLYRDLLEDNAVAKR